MVRPAGVAAETNYPVRISVGELMGVLKSDFSDLRFTTADGETTMPLWIESISGRSPHQVAIIWVKFPYVGENFTGAYLYYGNAEAEAVSSGNAVFSIFDDFERGNDGDTVGGAWTEVVAHAHISTEQQYGGTRALKIVGGGDTVQAELPVSASANIAIRYRIYKPTGCSVSVVHGNGSYCIYLNYHVDGYMRYTIDTVNFTNIGVYAHSAWHLVELNNFDYAAGTCDVWVNGLLVKSGAPLSNNATANTRGDNKVHLRAATDAWFDNVIVRKWCPSEGAIYVIGAQEALGVTPKSKWLINGVPHTGQILTVGPSGRDFTNPRDAFNAAEDEALVLLDPGTYTSTTNDSTDHVYEWRTKKIYWRGLGDAPSDTVLDNSKDISDMMIMAGDMWFENLQFNPCSTYGLLRYQHPITTGLILNKCKITNDRGASDYAVVNGWSYHDQIIDGGIKFLNVDFPDTLAGVFSGPSPTYPADLSKIYVSKCIIPDNDYYGYYLTGSFALADWVTSPAVGYGSNYGDFLITEGGGAIAAKEQYYRRLRNG